MIDKTDRKNSTAWECRVASALVAWVVLLFSAIFSLIGMSFIAASLNTTILVGSDLFVVEAVVSVVMAGISSYWVGRLAHRWFARRKPMTVYVWIVILLLIALLSFPAPSTFVLR